MLELLKDFSFKVLAFFLPSVVRWFYKPGKFAEGIKIRIRGEGDGVTYNCGELPNVRIWLLVTNLTPLEISIDRIYGQLFVGCQLAEFSHLKRHVLPPAQEKEIFFEFSLTDHQSQFIKRSLGNSETRLSLGAYVTSNVHNVELARQIGTGNVQHLNCAL